MHRRSVLGLAALTLCAAVGFGGSAALAAKPAKGAKKAVKGKIESVDATAKTFVISNKKAGTSITVTTNDSTKFVKQDDSAGAFTDLKAGDKVSANGAAPVDNKMTATMVHIGGAKKKEKPAAAAAK